MEKEISVSVALAIRVWRVLRDLAGQSYLGLPTARVHLGIPGVTNLGRGSGTRR